MGKINSKISKLNSEGKQSGKRDLKKDLKKSPPVLGRKRDPALDENILEAALEIIAELGFDNMTMDMVAARAKAGKATVYRRWASKGELVRDAIVWMSRHSVMVDKIPDTGTLRGDMLALMKPHDITHSEKKLRVLGKLGSFFTEHQELADEGLQQIYGPWIDMNLKLMRRAAERKEVSATADFSLACEVIVAITSYRVQVQRTSFGKNDYERLLDKIVLPALKVSIHK